MKKFFRFVFGMAIVSTILCGCMIGTVQAFVQDLQPPQFDTQQQQSQNQLDGDPKPELEEGVKDEVKKDYIRWIEFNPTSEIITKAIALTNHNLTKNVNTNTPDFYEILAYIALQNSNKFDKAKDNKRIKALQAALDNNNNLVDKYKDNKYFKYYVQCYKAVLSGIVGFDESQPQKFVLKGYHPIAKNHWYKDYDDFGSSRAYGYKRRHLGHDMFGSVGAPIMAVEGGTVQELGWNRYGGWRVGIRSFDTNRYYYYAHLRKKTPFPPELKIGDTISSGQVIGYLGNTGYGKEGATLKNSAPHLHFGLQIIFDPSQEKGPKEIWVDVHEIVKLLLKNRAVAPTKPKSDPQVLPSPN